MEIELSCDVHKRIGSIERLFNMNDGNRVAVEGANGPEPPQQTKMQALKDIVDGTIPVLKNNVVKLIEREEKLDDLVNISKDLEEEAKDFKRTSEKLACSFCLKNVKLIVVIVIVVLIIILIIVLLATGVIPVSSPAPPPIIPVVPAP